MNDVIELIVILGIVTLSEGVRRQRPDTLLVRHRPFLGWSVAPESGARFRLISWCIPFVLPLLLPDRASTDNVTRDPNELTRSLARFRRRQRRIERHAARLRVLGVLTLLALVFGVPVLTYRGGLWAFIVTLAFLAVLSMVQGAILCHALTRIGLSTEAALKASASSCWPFSAPRAAERLQAAVIGDLPRLTVLHELLSARDFERVARPLIYDALVRGEGTADVAALRCTHGDARLRQWIESPPSDCDGERYCPRCGAAFYSVTEFCSDCGVALVALHTDGDRRDPR